VVGHLVTVSATQEDIPDCHVANEHLVEVATLAMSLSTRADCRCKVERSQLLDDVCHVVVKVTTDDYRSVWVLPDDISYNFRDSHSSLLQVLLLSWMKIAIENLDIVVAELQLGPTEICSE
jgi:hypothetical protein